MRKLGILVFLCSLIMTVVPAVNAAPVDLVFEPGFETVYVGDSFSLGMWAKSDPAGQDIKGISAPLQWDESNLEFLGYTDEIGGMWTDFITYPGAGKATIDGAMFLGSEQTDLLVYTLEFKALAITGSPTEVEFLADTCVRDPSNEDITGTLTGANISIAAVPIPSAVMLLSSGLLGLWGIRRFRNRT